MTRRRLITLVALTLLATALVTWMTWKWTLYWHPASGVVFSLRDGAFHAFVWDPGHWIIRYNPGLDAGVGEQGLLLMPRAEGLGSWGTLIEGRQRSIALPWWLIALFAWGAAFAMRKSRSAYRRRRGRCEHCAYPLTGVWGPCPECGNARPADVG